MNCFYKTLLTSLSSRSITRKILKRTRQRCLPAVWYFFVFSSKKYLGAEQCTSWRSEPLAEGFMKLIAPFSCAD